MMNFIYKEGMGNDEIDLLFRFRFNHSYFQYNIEPTHDACKLNTLFMTKPCQTNDLTTFDTKMSEF